MKKGKKVCAVLHLNAGHDVNGNPRRCFVCIGRDGQVFDAVDEGYNGIAALWCNHPELQKNPVFPIVLDTTPGEYRALLREYDK